MSQSYSNPKVGRFFERRCIDELNICSLKTWLTATCTSELCVCQHATSIVALRWRSQFTSYHYMSCGFVGLLIYSFNATTVVKFIWIGLAVFVIYCKTNGGVFFWTQCSFISVSCWTAVVASNHAINCVSRWQWWHCLSSDDILKVIASSAFYTSYIIVHKWNKIIAIFYYFLVAYVT